MLEPEKFAPGVMVDGVSVEPEGWMWVLAFAIGGCDWAVKIVSAEDYDLRGKINDYNRRKKNYQRSRQIEFTETAIVELERKIERLRGEMQC